MQYSVRFVELPRNDKNVGPVTELCNAMANDGWRLTKVVADQVLTTEGAGGWAESGAGQPDTRTLSGFTRGAWLFFETS